MSNPSQKQANEVLRVLEGSGPLKYTCRVHKPGGEVVEFQSDGMLDVTWHEQARGLWLVTKSGKYANEIVPVMAWADGFILTCEQNPGFKEKE